MPLPFAAPQARGIFWRNSSKMCQVATEVAPNNRAFVGRPVVMHMCRPPSGDAPVMHHDKPVRCNAGHEPPRAARIRGGADSGGAQAGRQPRRHGRRCRRNCRCASRSHSVVNAWQSRPNPFENACACSLIRSSSMFHRGRECAWGRLLSLYSHPHQLCIPCRRARAAADRYVGGGPV